MSRSNRWYVPANYGKGALHAGVGPNSGVVVGINRHDPVEDQHRALEQKLRGPYGYYGIIGKCPRPLAVLLGASPVHGGNGWTRRLQRARMNWNRFKLLLARYPLPQPRLTIRTLDRAVNP